MFSVSMLCRSDKLNIFSNTFFSFIPEYKKQIPEYRKQIKMKISIFGRDYGIANRSESVSELYL